MGATLAFVVGVVAIAAFVVTCRWWSHLVARKGWGSPGAEAITIVLPLFALGTVAFLAWFALYATATGMVI